MSEEIVIDCITISINHYFTSIDCRRVFCKFVSIEYGLCIWIFMRSCFFICCYRIRTGTCINQYFCTFIYFYSCCIVWIRTYIVIQVVAVSFISVDVPVTYCSRCFACKVEDIIFNIYRTTITMSIVPDCIDSFFDIECVVVNLTVSGISCRI